MAAVAAEPGAAASQTTTITAAAEHEGPLQPASAGQRFPASPLDIDEPAAEAVVARMVDGADGEERRHVELAAGKALLESAVTEELINNLPVDRTGNGRFSPGDPEGGGNVSVQAGYRSILAESSAVFLHSFPAPPPVTEAGLSLAEPAEPTTNETTDRADTTNRDRGYTALVLSESGAEPAEQAVFDDSAERLSVPDGLDLDLAYAKTSAGTEELPGRGPRDSSSPCRSPKRRLLPDTVKQEACTRPESGSAHGVGPVHDLSPGSEVRVCLDHVIDDALVVSFRLGEKVFSGVLMDVAKRFGPYGIPITVHPRRDDQSRAQLTMQPQPQPQPQPITSNDASTKQEEVSPTSQPAAHPHPWTSKPPPLFQEGAPYPPPLFIRDTYNQALPQPLPRKIKRPKRRYRCEEPTSIMNAIKLRPRQVLCDKCKGVVASGGHREARRGPLDLRGEEVSRRRRPGDGPIPSELKRLRSYDKGGRPTVDRRSSSGMRVSASSSTPSHRALRGVASSSSSSASSNSHMCLKLNSKKALAKGADQSKARQVLKKLARNSRPPQPHQRAKDQNQNQNEGHNQDHSKAVTRAAALQNHNQKVHFTRRQHHSNATISSSSHTPLPPRMRIKPQRYRTDDSQVPCSSSSSSSSSSSTKQTPRTSPPKPAVGVTPPATPTTAPHEALPPPSTILPPSVTYASSATIAKETEEIRPPEEENQGEQEREGEEEVEEEEEEEEVAQEQEQEPEKAGDEGHVEVLPPRCSSSLNSSHSECSSTETFDLPTPGFPPSSSSPTPPLSTSSPATPVRVDGEEMHTVGEEEEGGELKRRRKSSTSSSSSSTSSTSSVFSKLVSKCLLPDGRTVCVGDIVWAKIYGFPWWPARVLGITVSRRGDTGLAVRQEARVSWFGSPTTSFLPLSQLSPFLESFQSRFDRKRKGPYRRAIAEAASAAKQLTPEVRALLTQFET